MLIIKPDPIGIDIYIERLQACIYKDITSKWSRAKYTSYGRCDRNLKNGKYVAEVYCGNGKTTDVLWDDKAEVVSFFGVDPVISNNTQRRINVHLVFFCDLKSVKAEKSGRPDEDVRVDILNLIGKCLYGFHMITVETGMEKVLKEYNGSLAKVRAIDQGKLHAFRVNFTLSYNQNFSSTLKLN
jgi:hypothetical protein